MNSRARQGQGYLGLLAALVLVGVMSYLEFGTGSGGSGVSATTVPAGAGISGGATGQPSYGAVIGAARSAAANQSKPDQFSGGNSGLLPTTTTVTAPAPVYAAPSVPNAVTSQKGWLALANKVAVSAEDLAGGADVASLDPAVGQSYLQLAYTDVASGVGAQLAAKGTKWQLSSSDGKLNACLSGGTVVAVTSGVCG